MENIVQAVEGAIGSASTEAKKVETAVAGDIKADVKAVETDAARLEGKIAGYFQAAGHLATYEVHAVTKAAIAEFSKVTNTIEHTRVALELEHLVHETGTRRTPSPRPRRTPKRTPPSSKAPSAGSCTESVAI
jgi:hypothetical protein